MCAYFSVRRTGIMCVSMTHRRYNVKLFRRSPLGVASQHRVLRRDHAHHFRPVPLGEKHMTDDAVSISPSAARTLLHLSRHTRTDIVEKRPARAHQDQFTLQFFL